MVEIRPFSVVATLEPYAEYSNGAESNDQHDKHDDPAVVSTPPFRGAILSAIGSGVCGCSLDSDLRRGIGIKHTMTYSPLWWCLICLWLRLSWNLM